MNTTHPDILAMERYGTLHPEKDAEVCLGRCHGCGSPITDDWEYWETDTGLLFCGEDCLFRHFGITHVC